MKTALRLLSRYYMLHPTRFWVIAGVIFLLVVIGLSIASYIYEEKNTEIQHADSPEKEEDTTGFSSKERPSGILTGMVIGLVAMVIFIFSIAGMRYFKRAKPTLTVENTYLSTSGYLFGIDISHYQGRIDWESVQNTQHPLKFVFIRATMGVNGKDSHYNRNWKSARQSNYIRGAYHFYRPDENPVAQFENYRASVRLESGDFVPVLDIESSGTIGIANLRKGVLRWLALAEEAYGVKPIVYTGSHFYQTHLNGYLDEYPLWISAFSGKHRVQGLPWRFHQFTDKIRIKGIRSTVDGNHFNGDISDLAAFRIK